MFDSAEMEPSKLKSQMAGMGFHKLERKMDVTENDRKRGHDDDSTRESEHSRFEAVSLLSKIKKQEPVDIWKNTMAYILQSGQVDYHDPHFNPESEIWRTYQDWLKGENSVKSEITQNDSVDHQIPEIKLEPSGGIHNGIKLDEEYDQSGHRSAEELTEEAVERLLEIMSINCSETGLFMESGLKSWDARTNCGVTETQYAVKMLEKIMARMKTQIQPENQNQLGNQELSHVSQMKMEAEPTAVNEGVRSNVVGEEFVLEILPEQPTGAAGSIPTEATQLRENVEQMDFRSTDGELDNMEYDSEDVSMEIADEPGNAAVEEQLVVQTNLLDGIEMVKDSCVHALPPMTPSDCHRGCRIYAVKPQIEDITEQVMLEYASKHSEIVVCRWEDPDTPQLLYTPPAKTPSNSHDYECTRIYSVEPYQFYVQDITEQVLLEYASQSQHSDAVVCKWEDPDTPQLLYPAMLPLTPAAEDLDLSPLPSPVLQSPRQSEELTEDNSNQELVNLNIGDLIESLVHKFI